MPFIGGALAGAGSLFGGLFGSNAASSAAKAQVQASQNAINAQLGVDRVINSQLAPFFQTGTNAFQNLATLLGVGNSPGVPQGGLLQTPQQVAGIPNAPQSPTGAPTLSLPDPSNPATISQFQQSPGYNYLLKQSSDAIQNSAAGKVGALSGNTLEALQQNATGLASQDYYNWLNAANSFGLNNFNANNQNFWNTYNANNQNYWNQYNAGEQQQQDLYNRLFGLSSLGQSAAGGSANALTQVGGNVGNALIGQGNAIAAGTIGGTQALTGGINNALAQFNTPNNSGVSPLQYLFGQGGGSYGYSPNTGGADGYPGGSPIY